MEIKVSELKALYRLLAEKTGQPTDHKGLKEIAAAIGEGISQKFLYTKQNEARKSSNGLISIQNTKCVILLKFLGLGDYQEFRRYLEQPIPEILKSCEGTWVNYVRQNSHRGVLYSSPVQIYQAKQRMYYELKGPKSLYRGEISLNNGCLFSLFSTENGKQFHHVYKIGNMLCPDVLQGIFSGVSTANEPIGGRTVLVRTEQAFEELQNKELSVIQLRQENTEQSKALSHYFDSYEKNNLALGPVVTYGIDNLLMDF